MSTDMVLHDVASLTEQMEFARIVVAQPDRGAQSILPESYKGNPANVLIAVGLGASMGLSPAESLYRIAVIKGKPTAGAELIASNVRKAGHRLRVRGDETTCTASIWRADDSDYEFSITRDLAWAKGMGLASGPNYIKQPGTMLQWRAITAVARLACPEALYGVTYTPDEMDDLRPAQHVSAAPVASGADRLRATLAKPEVIDLGEVEMVDEPVQGTNNLADNSEPIPLSDRTRSQMFALLTEHGITDRDRQIAGISSIIGRPIASRSELTEDDARAVILDLQARA